jgi:DNA invertase Pin-like site-specific DNA recombinase
VRWASRLEQALNRRPISKLTAEQAIAIRTDPRPTLKIAEQYHVTRTTIGEIKRRETWKHLP